tara:strand:+ start:229 stop:474 length:246 start_codon:yes stop_codon:yes gene_type:complete
MTTSRQADDRPIDEMRNLGPAFVKMLYARKKQGRSAKACNAGYLYALYGAIHDVDWRDVPEEEKARFKAFTAELRESGQFS